MKETGGENFSQREWSAIPHKSALKHQGPGNTLREMRVKMAWRGASLVAQWLRIRLPMQGTQVRSLVREDPTCHGATKPVHHNH